MVECIAYCEKGNINTLRLRWCIPSVEAVNNQTVFCSLYPTDMIVSLNSMHPYHAYIVECFKCNFRFFSSSTIAKIQFFRSLVSELSAFAIFPCILMHIMLNCCECKHSKYDILCNRKYQCIHKNLYKSSYSNANDFCSCLKLFVSQCKNANFSM